MQFYFDYLSHNAWLAWERAQRISGAQAIDLEAVPVLFAGLLKAWGQLGPAEVPPKSRWMLANVIRKAAMEGLTINPPVCHPFNPLLSLRMTCAIEPGDARNRFVSAVFAAVWTHAQDVTQADTLLRIAGDCGLDAGAMFESAGSAEVKAQLRQNTDDAIALAVFGVPTVRIDEQLFWGYDDLDWLERYLDGSDPLPAGELERWAQLPRADRSSPSGYRDPSGG